MKQLPSLKFNMLISGLRIMLSICFPLITIPYISRIMDVDYLGRYHFVLSVISYFSLLAGLGVSTYATREGARLREDRIRFNRFANEMFTITTVSTLVSLALLLLCILLVPKFRTDLLLFLIFSIQIIFGILCVDWVYSAYEDYLYITLRTAAVQVLSLVLLLLLVKRKEDIYLYAGITAFSQVGNYIVTFLHSRVYCRLRWTRQIPWKRHLKPIFLLFALKVTTSLYISSDTTVLGFLSGEYAVGLYSISTKVYEFMKQIFIAVSVVSIPRISAMLGSNDRDGVHALTSELYKLLLTAIFPAMVGLLLMREEVVLILAGPNFLPAASSLGLLSLALMFGIGSWFWGQCVLVPFQEERTLFHATVVSALVNLGLNVLLIPIWQERAAAFTTILAEAVVFFWCSRKGGKLVQLSGISTVMWKVGIGCLCIYGVVSLVRLAQLPLVMHTAVCVGLSVVVYFVVELVLKNEALTGITGSILQKIKRKNRPVS